MILLNVFAAIVGFVMAGDYRRNDRPALADFWLAASVMNFVVVAIEFFRMANT